MTPARPATLTLALTLLACGGHEPKNAWTSQEQVPSNSAFAPQAERASQPAESPEAPAPSAAEPASATSPTQLVADDDAPRPGANKPSGPKATRAQCAKMIDRYVELVVRETPALEGVGKDLIDQAKATARSQKGDPCEGDVTRAQYECAMKAKSKDGWEACAR